MATTASARPSLTLGYTLQASDSYATVSETAIVGYTNQQWTNGTGTGNINIGVVHTGYIASGETVVLDFSAFPKKVWDDTIDLNFTSDLITHTPPMIESNYSRPQRGIKAILLTNNWKGSLAGSTQIESWFPSSGVPRLNLHATGIYGFTKFFNGESGNIAINPQSTWATTDLIGITPIYDSIGLNYNHQLTISTENFTNVSGTGGYFIWNDNGPTNPWSGNLPRIPYELIVVGVTGTGA